jgi:hypothetical protein
MGFAREETMAVVDGDCIVGVGNGVAEVRYTSCVESARTCKSNTYVVASDQITSENKYSGKINRTSRVERPSTNIRSKDSQSMSFGQSDQFTAFDAESAFSPVSYTAFPVGSHLWNLL